MRVGGKYIIIAVGKESQTFLCEVDENMLDLSARDEALAPAFSDILNKFKKSNDTGTGDKSGGQG